MKKIIVAFAALITFVAFDPAYAQVQTKSALSSEITTQFPDQNTGAITPQILRNVTNDFVTSWQQAPTVNAQTGITYTIQASDYGKLVTLNNSGAIAVTLPQAIGSFSIFNVYVSNLGSGAATITPTGSTINGSASLVLSQNQYAWILSDGTNYQIGPSGTLGGSLVVGTTPISGGSSNGLLYNNAGVLGNLATANNGVLVTGGTGIPSISSTLPSGLTIISPTVSGTGAPLTVNSTDSTAFKVRFQDNGTQRGFVGADSTYAAEFFNSSATSLWGFDNSTGALTPVGGAYNVGTTGNRAGAFIGATASLTGQLTSTLATGTAPFVIASTTQVANLNAATAGTATTATNATNTAITDDTTTNATMLPTWVTANTGNLPQKVTSTKFTFNPSTGVLSSTSFTGAGTGLTGTAASLTAGNVTTNANLTGPITSSGNATSIASQTGTGTKFVVDTSPTIITPIFTTSATTPLLIGGSATGSSLSLESTSASGATDFIAFLTASQQERMRITTGGLVGIGTNAPTVAQLFINANTGTVTPPSGTQLEIAAADSAAATLTMDAFASLNALNGRRAAGTAASKTAVQNNDSVFFIGANAYDGSAYGSTGAAFGLVADENQSGTNHGMRIDLYATKNGTTSDVKVATFDGKAHLGYTGTAPAITSCGTSPSTARGTDSAGEVTEGTTATGCIITFANSGYTAAPYCVVTSQTQLAAFTYAISTTAITITNTSTSNDKINWVCHGI